MDIDVERCYRAVESRDARFDGWFITAVTSTGIYCRPSCPARTPRREHVRFHPSAAAAQAAGFRACKRCRPDAAPGSPEWDVRGDVVARAMRLIADGAVDREGVRGLAARLGYSERQLNRVLLAEVGAGPLALARAQRAQTARILLETTDLPVAQVAFASGFGSVRQCNATIREVFAVPPTALRTRSRGGVPAPAGRITLRLAHREPFDAEGLLARLTAHAVPGLEEGSGAAFRRALSLPGGGGVAELSPGPGHVVCGLRLDDVRDLGAAVQRCRRLLDLDADPVAVDEVLGADPHLAAAVAARPGVRVARTVDPAELAIRAVLAQQVGVAAAAALTARLVAALGPPLDAGRAPGAGQPSAAVAARRSGVTHRFPDAAAIAGSDLGFLGVPERRRTTVRDLAAALARGEVVLDAGTDRAAATQALARITGLGPWTIGIILQRGLGDPDVLPANDLALRRGAARLGLPGHARGLAEAASPWRPWRSYAAQHLWAAAAASGRAPAAASGRAPAAASGRAPAAASGRAPAAASSGGVATGGSSARAAPSEASAAAQPDQAISEAHPSARPRRDPVTAGANR